MRSLVGRLLVGRCDGVVFDGAGGCGWKVAGWFGLKILFEKKVVGWKP